MFTFKSQSHPATVGIMTEAKKEVRWVHVGTRLSISHFLPIGNIVFCYHDISLHIKCVYLRVYYCKHGYEGPLTLTKYLTKF